MPSIVRLAAPTDAPDIMGLLRLFHAETGIGEFDEAMAAEVLHRGLARNWAMVGVVRGPRGIEGSVGLFVSSAWCSRDQYLQDLWAFVHPEHRKSTHMKEMLKFAKWAATELGTPLVMSLTVNETTAAKELLYGRQLPRTGSLFMFNVPASATQASAAA